MDAIKNKELEFGTAGLREIMGNESNQMNSRNVRRAAYALCKLMLSDNPFAKLVIAYDMRNNSQYFAKEAALTAAKLGVCTYIFSACMPTPILSFAVRKLHCDGGIVITASHNTKEYNGFKAYDSTGCQLNTEKSEKVSEIYKSIDDAPCISEEKAIQLELVKYLGSEIADDYVERVKSISCCSPKSRIGVVYTPLHGTGSGIVDGFLSKLDYVNLYAVSEQCVQDGEFPTLITPNPEENEALSLALALAKKKNAELVLATDPDCDRIGVAVRHKGEYIKLTGNQVGALLTEYIFSHGNAGDYIIKTVVTDGLGAEIAKNYGAEVIETLTGFRFIGEKINENCSYKRLAIAYEESCGYLVHENIREKDGISAAGIICEMTAAYTDKNMTLIDALEEIYKKYGYFVEYKASVKSGTLTEKLRKGTAFTGAKCIDYVNSIDGLPPADMLKYVYPNGSWAVVRPSGTEPKVKIYYCARGKTRDEAEKMLDKMKKEELPEQLL